MALSPKRRGTLKWLTLLSVVGLLGFGAYELFFWFTHVYEFDARIRTDLTRISSKVNGTIETIEVVEGARVKQGDVLVTMQSGAVRQRIEALRADIARASAEADKLTASKHALEVDLDARAATKLELVRALEIERKALVERHDLAEKKLKRTLYLVSRKLVPEQNLEDDQDHVLGLAGQVSVAAAKVNVAEREVAEISAKRADIAVLDESIKILRIESRRLEAQIEEQKVDLEDRIIRSPINGVVDRIFKNVGEYVEDADQLLIVHDPSNIWIEANIGEDQIRHLVVGQPVRVDLDAYPFDTFAGEVTAIAMVTTADLAIGGTDSGSKALKSTQKIPVRIKLLDPPPLAAPGMLVEVNIQIRDKASLR